MKEPKSYEQAQQEERARRIAQAEALGRPGTVAPRRDEFAERFPLASRKAREDAAREQAIRRAQARSLFIRTHAPGTPLPKELIEPENGAA